MPLILRLAEVPADSHRSSQHPYCSSAAFPETYYSVKGTAQRVHTYGHPVLYKYVISNAHRFPIGLTQIMLYSFLQDELLQTNKGSGP